MVILKASNVLVSEIMTTNVISVHADTSLVEAAKILSEHHFNGLPVVDADNRLLGILTEFDLLSKSVPIHLPTFQMLLQNIPVFQKDKSLFQGDVKTILELKAGDVMNKEPMVLGEKSTYEEAVELFKEHHRVNPIPVVDINQTVVGIVSRFDILKPLYALQNLKK